MSPESANFTLQAVRVSGIRRLAWRLRRDSPYGSSAGSGTHPRAETTRRVIARATDERRRSVSSQRALDANSTNRSPKEPRTREQGSRSGCECNDLDNRVHPLERMSAL